MLEQITGLAQNKIKKAIVFKLRKSAFVSDRLRRRMAECMLNLQTELHSFMEVLLKSIVYEVSEIFRNRMFDSEIEFEDKLHSISRILVRRTVSKITQCVEDSFGSEMAQLKNENESLKWRLQLWEKESGAGGDQAQTDHVGHTLPCEVTAEIKEEMGKKLELPGPEASAFSHAGERAPLEQQHSEEEWGSSLMQETEPTAAEEKEKLSEQHTESRQSVVDLDCVPMIKTEPESETSGFLVFDDFTEKINNLDMNNIKEGCNELDCGSVQNHKEHLDKLHLKKQDIEPQLIDPAEQQMNGPGEENSTDLQHPKESQYRKEQQQLLQGFIIRSCAVKVERLSLHKGFKQMNVPLVSMDFTEKCNNLDTNNIAEHFNEVESVSVQGHKEEEQKELNFYSLGEQETGSQLPQPAEQHTDEEYRTELQHTEESQYREEGEKQQGGPQDLMNPSSAIMQRLSVQQWIDHSSNLKYHQLTAGQKIKRSHPKPCSDEVKKMSVQHRQQQCFQQSGNNAFLLDDATAAIVRQNAHHTPAISGEESRVALKSLPMCARTVQDAGSAGDPLLGPCSGRPGCSPWCPSHTSLCRPDTRSAALHHYHIFF
ncbi:uncharacterized protein [Lepisosteus oculatus]|uniref:uncharacterized protein isoform X3 n=1 Tax=Lepisosteus oculatus TaxID=7918 RepID=UPI00371C89FF